MPDRRLLALSYSFPPLALPEAALSAKRLAHLSGWKADVVAAAPFHRSIDRDDDLLAYAQSHIASVTRVQPLIPALWPLAARLNHIPDAFRFLNGRTLRAVRRLGVTHFDAMLSWSQYHSIHIAAYAIKKDNPRLPWVAHFSDPWVDNPFSHAKGAELETNRALERSVIEGADRVLFTTPETLDLVMAKYPDVWRGKARVIPHGFEPALYADAERPPLQGRRKVLRYLGNFYGHRTPQPLFRALAVALARRPTLTGEITVEIIGGFERGMPQRPADGLLPQDMIVVRPPVGYLTSLSLMKTADVLLVVDAPDINSVFLPSKLVDYLGAGRPIVAITPSGASARVLREIGHLAADPNDPEAGASALLEALTRCEARQGPLSPAAARYSAAHTGAELAAVLEELVN